MKASDVRDAFKYLFPDELPALQTLVRSLRPNPFVVNIGAGAGTSGLAILESRHDVTLLTIDVQNESSPFGCLEAERQVVAKAGLRHLWGERWFQIQADSKAAGHEWLDGIELKFGGPIFEAHKEATSGLRWGKQPNMVFVDGAHEYENAYDDIAIWITALYPQGIIAVHDYKKSNLAPDPNGPHPHPWPGVDRAVDELLLNNYPLVLHVDSLIAFRKDH